MNNEIDNQFHYTGDSRISPGFFEQINKGVLGRNFVVNPGVIHGGATQFIAERVFASNANNVKWMEAGWAEVSWRGDAQYIYEYDTATNTWHFYDQFPLSAGTAVQTLVKSDSYNYWIAELYWNGNNYRLAREFIGFNPAVNGYNRGEAYTADGVHPILPLSKFDMGYLNLTGGSIWEVWNTRYFTIIDEDDPYECDMIYEYDKFNIHSRIIFLPLVIKNF